MTDRPPPGSCYRLDADGEPVYEPSIIRWGRWFETSMPARLVAHDMIDGTEVSTIFLGIDHGFSWVEGPVLWETMAFGPEETPTDPPPLDWPEALRRMAMRPSRPPLYQRRYATRDEAISGHAKVVTELVAHGRLPEEGDDDDATARN